MTDRNGNLMLGRRGVLIGLVATAASVACSSSPAAPAATVAPAATAAPTAPTAAATTPTAAAATTPTAAAATSPTTAAAATTTASTPAASATAASAANATTTPAASAATTPTTSTATTPAASAATTPSAAASPTGAANAFANVKRLSGTVQTVNSGKVTLDDGSSFTVGSNTRVIRSQSATFGDFKVGDYVAITAKQQPDNSLLASVINVFPDSMRNTAPGQRPMTGGNLMTNATIQQIVGSDGLMVQFPNGTAQVKVAPNARLTKLTDATVADIKEGVAVSVLASGDQARSVTIEPSTSA